MADGISPDHCEIWLEALTRTGQELRLNVLPSPPAVLAPETVRPENGSLVTTGKLTAGQKNSFAQLARSLQLEVITL